MFAIKELRSDIRMSARLPKRGIFAFTIILPTLCGCAPKAINTAVSQICAPTSARAHGGDVCAPATLSGALDTSTIGSISPNATPSNPTAAASGADDATAKIDQPKNRLDVMPKLAEASPDFIGDVAPGGMPPLDSPHHGADTAAPKGPAGQIVASLSLEQAVAAAVLSHPLMGAAAAKISRAKADIGVAQSAWQPSLSVTGGTGWATLGQYSSYPVIVGAANLPGTSRTDLGLSFRQLIYDFGAATEEVERNKALVDSETLKLADQAEDIGLRTVNSYLNLLEQQELLSLIDSTIANERKLAGLVKLSQQNGNSAASDVDRVNSKILEIEAARTDISSAYNVALDEFRRLTNVEPKQVRRPQLAPSLIPQNVDIAIKEAKSQNPSVLAIRANAVSLEHQFAEQKASTMPRIDFEGDSLVKHYMGVPSASVGVVDNRAMVVLSYKIFDGGLQSSQLDHIRASQDENDFSELDQLETLELNLRRFYETLAADNAKRSAADRGVVTADKVNTAYTEQFKAGKRTIFEVLDSFTSIYSMKKNKINGEYEALRSQYGILRNLGRLNKALAELPAKLPAHT